MTPKPPFFSATLLFYLGQADLRTQFSTFSTSALFHAHSQLYAHSCLEVWVAAIVSKYAGQLLAVQCLAQGQRSAILLMKGGKGGHSV